MYFSNSQEELLTNTLRDRCNYKNTVNEIVDFVKAECTKRNLDFEKVSNKVIEAVKNTSEIRALANFVRAIVTKLDDANYKINTKSISFLSIHLAFGGYVGEMWETDLIDLLEDYCLNTLKIDVSEIIWTNRAIIRYCNDKGTTTFKAFISWFLKSKMLRGKEIDLDGLTSKAKEIAAKREKTISEIESVPEVKLNGTNI